MQKEKVNVTSMELVPANVPMVSGAPADPAITSAKIDLESALESDFVFISSHAAVQRSG